MKAGITLGGLLLGGIAITLGQMNATAIADGDGVAGSIGQDVIVGSIPNMQKFGTVGGITAYSAATTSCNIGDEILDWVASTNIHPVIPQNLYRYKDGRLEQIGQSWLKHGFCALQQTLCGPCQPAGGGCPPRLGIGCSDPYSSSLNGQQSNLGPRSEVNAATGFFPYPFSAPAAPAVVGRRLQVANVDLDPALNPGAEYFVEGMYVHPQDAEDGNDNNNASYRPVNVGSFSGGGYNLSTTGSTRQMQPAIYAWQEVDPSVEIVPIDIEGDGRILLGYTVIDNGDGTWNYEYAIYNLNSNLSVGSLAMAVPDSFSTSDAGFSDCDSHSGEPYSNSDWSPRVTDGILSWSTVPVALNPDANAIRWNTMYNFWLTSDQPPVEGELSIGLFKNGASITMPSAFVPSIPSNTCLADLNNDGQVNGADLGILLGEWNEEGDNIADLNGDLNVSGADLGILLGAWGPCP